MRSALFAASFALTASAAQIKRQGEFSLPVEPNTWTSDGIVYTGLPLGTFTETDTNTNIVVPTVPVDTLSIPEDTPIVSVPTETVIVSTPTGSTVTTPSDTMTVTTPVTETETETQTETETDATESGSPTETGDGGEGEPDAATLAKPFVGALAVIAAVGVVMGL